MPEYGATKLKNFISEHHRYEEVMPATLFDGWMWQYGSTASA
jgi:hypothetical protein